MTSAFVGLLAAGTNTKLAIVFLAVLAGVMMGLALSKRIKDREKYFDELVRIVERLISDIKFSQTRIEQILGEYTTISPLIAQNLSEYKIFLSGGELRLSRGMLTRREHRLVSELFTRLGSLDLDTQLSELEGRRAVFEGFKQDAKQRLMGYGKAFVKLGFLAGLLVGILLL